MGIVQDLKTVKDAFITTKINTIEDMTAMFLYLGISALPSQVCLVGERDYVIKVKTVGAHP